LRFVESAKRSDTIQALLDGVKTKRFTYAKLRRILLYLLFEIDNELIRESNAYGPQYIRVLGFDSVGQETLKLLRSRSRLPVLSTGSTFLKMLRKLEKPGFAERLDPEFRYALFRKQIELNFRMTDFYRKTFFNQTYISPMDIQTPPIRVLNKPD
ncbi:MAG: nucleotidyltransferase family protein, partial [Thermotogota bacterium]|nr:nucleotidyltransferase family protein [Thermotogota bacterium]